MTQDEILTELHSVITGNQKFTTWTISTPHIVELVNRAIKQEREACLDIADSWSGHYQANEIAEKIRARR